MKTVSTVNKRNISYLWLLRLDWLANFLKTPSYFNHCHFQRHLLGKEIERFKYIIVLHIKNCK